MKSVVKTSTNNRVIFANENSVDVDCVMWAIGREPNIDLNLDKAVRSFSILFILWSYIFFLVPNIQILEYLCCISEGKDILFYCFNRKFYISK